jgi:hypothetical protein
MVSKVSSEPDLVHDLVIRGGTLVAAWSSAAECDVGISGAVVSQMGGAPRGRRYLDAFGALVLPGGIDMHVHLSSPAPSDPAKPTLWVPIIRPCWSGSMPVLVEGAAEPVLSADIEVRDPLRISNRSG